MSSTCGLYRPVQAVFIPFFLCWLFALVWWVHNTFFRNNAHANNLQRMLTWLPAVECAYTFLAIFYYGACPWESLGSQLLAAALLMVVILKEPLNLLCLLLCAKGWFITRDSLGVAENRALIVTVILLYAATVIELFAPANAVGVLWMVPIILAYALVLLSAGWSAWINLRILKAQLLAMAQLNIDPLTTPAYAKYVMFRRLAMVTAAYALLEVLIHTVTSVVYTRPFVFPLLHQSMELACALYVGWQFRARPLSSVFQHMQEFGLHLAEQLLPTVSSVSINTLELSAPGMVQWSDKLELPAGHEAEDEGLMMLVVVNPGAEGATDDDGTLCVQTAIPSEVAAAAEQAARERERDEAEEKAARESQLAADAAAGVAQQPPQHGAVELAPSAVARRGGGEASGSSLSEETNDADWKPGAQRGAA